MNDFSSLQDIVDEVDARRKRDRGIVRVVVAGEFQTGKSSVINALLRRTVVPCNPGLPSRPLIKIVHSLNPQIDVWDSEGQDQQVETMEDVAKLSDVVQCDLAMLLPGLPGIEIVEIPFRHGAGISLDDLETMADADLMIWVTIASQAWRLSEKAIVEKLGRSSNNSILAISRADKLKTAQDWDKIETRLQKDASPFFSELVFIQASTANFKNARDDDRAWVKTGGAALASIVHDAVAARRPLDNGADAARRSA